MEPVMNVNRTCLAAAALAAAISLSGCSKKQEQPEATSPPAQTAAESPAAAPAPASVPAATVGTEAANDKAAAIRTALAEEAIASDPRGQWAVAASASSTYSGDKTPTAKTSYSPTAATGAPNVDRYGDNGNSWATETADKGIEWLEVKFDKPVNATQIRIRQSYSPGAIIKVELLGEDGSKNAVWEGVDSEAYAPNAIAWFDRSFDKTAYKVAGARITLATNAVPGWNEIDAVQLLGD
jgi:hypothetical protein